ncbi:MAG: hypothetical protein NTW86_14795 [Candidatus Sumerlaeota bacterium]|nr:hypothetical protein [Candidatus Sumerlaeota bacterium]
MRILREPISIKMLPSASLAFVFEEGGEPGEWLSPSANPAAKATEPGARIVPEINAPERALNAPERRKSYNPVIVL